MPSRHEPARKSDVQKCTFSSSYTTRANSGAQGSAGGGSASPLASGVEASPDTIDEEEDTGIADEDVYGGVPTGPDDGGPLPVPDDTMVTPAENPEISIDPFERIRDRNITYAPT